MVQGFPKDWTLPEHFDEAQGDRIDSLRYHAVGNAVTPPVAEWVGKRLMSVLSAEMELSDAPAQVAAE
jgi:DNA (cytosine-5)-methyltransferase 1